MLQILGEINPDNSDQEGIKKLMKLLKDNGYLIVYSDNKAWAYIVRDISKKEES